MQARNIRFRVTLLAAALSLPSLVFAQSDDAKDLDNVVVTATRTAQSLDQTLAQALIISRDEIDAAGVATLTELLQRKAGLEIRATGGPGQPSSVFIRGSNSSHTLVLVDGLRIASSSSGATSASKSRRSSSLRITKCGSSPAAAAWAWSRCAPNA